MEKSVLCVEIQPVDFMFSWVKLPTCFQLCQPKRLVPVLRGNVVLYFMYAVIPKKEAPVLTASLNAATT